MKARGRKNVTMRQGVSSAAGGPTKDEEKAVDSVDVRMWETCG